MKQCFKCLTEKPLDDFYAHPQMADGHLNKCKVCTRIDMAKDRRTNPRARKYDRDRSSQPHRKALKARVVARWRAAFPERTRAHSQAERVHVKAPTVCEGCALQRRLERHHPDYSKPLLVIWLCKPCHAIADKIRRRMEAEAA